MSDPVTSKSDSDELVYHDYSSNTSSWSSDASVGAVFRALSVNMVLTNHLEEDEDDGLLQSEDDPWIKHLNTLWDTHFEQHEPHTRGQTNPSQPQD